MNRIVYLFFLLIAGAVSVRGQGSLHLTLPSAGQDIRFTPLPDTMRGLAAMTDGRIRTLQPDQMRCLLPDLSRVERMPLLWSLSADPMPNGARVDKYSARPPRIYFLRVLPVGK